MLDTLPKSKIARHDSYGEVHFAISGFWELDNMEAFLEDLNKASYPLVKEQKPIRVLGEMGGFLPQTRDTGDAISDHLKMSKKYGLERVAIITDSSLVKMQYRRLSQGIEVDFFEDKVSAIKWLRRPS